MQALHLLQAALGAVHCKVTEEAWIDARARSSTAVGAVKSGVVT